MRAAFLCIPQDAEYVRRDAHHTRGTPSRFPAHRSSYFRKTVSFKPGKCEYKSGTVILFKKSCRSYLIMHKRHFE